MEKPQNPQKLTNKEALSFLSQNFLQTLIIDTCQTVCCSIPGSRVISFQNDGIQELLEDIDDIGNGFTNYEVDVPNVDFRVGDYCFIYDETGIESAFTLALKIIKEYKKTVLILENGIKSFSQEFPWVTKQSAIPNIVNHIKLGSLGGIDLPSLYKTQKELVDLVWFKKHAEQPSQIIPDFLYLSSCHASKPEILTRYGIQDVIRIGWGFEKVEQVTYYDFPIQDSPKEDILTYLDEITLVIEMLRNKGKRVLVHCHAGVSRSSTVVLAYLIKYGGMPLYHAWNLVYKQRPIIRPNIGFSKALQVFEEKERGSVSLGQYWMSESYFCYMEYIEFMYRCAGV
jgi:protein-tyrosine phosphatase